MHSHNAIAIVCSLPFQEKYSGKGAFVLCKTSNPGSNDLLALNLANGEAVFERIALLAEQWSQTSGATLGLVVGATDAEALRKARMAAGPKVWILAPGVGAQGGNLEEACKAGLNDEGTAMLIPVSRGISRAEDPCLLYTSPSPRDQRGSRMPSSA